MQSEDLFKKECLFFDKGKYIPLAEMYTQVCGLNLLGYIEEVWIEMLGLLQGLS